MKSGITFALLLGVLISISGLVLKSMQFTDPIRLTIANGITMAGIFVVVIAFVFWMLRNAHRQH
jgi:hypothetical protein